MENVKLFFDNKEIEFHPVEDFAITYEKPVEWVNATIEINGLICNIKIDKDDYNRLKARSIKQDFEKQIVMEINSARMNGKVPIYKITEFHG